MNVNDASPHRVTSSVPPGVPETGTAQQPTTHAQQLKFTQVVLQEEAATLTLPQRLVTLALVGAHRK